MCPKQLCQGLAQYSCQSQLPAAMVYSAAHSRGRRPGLPLCPGRLISFYDTEKGEKSHADLLHPSLFLATQIKLVEKFRSPCICSCFYFHFIYIPCCELLCAKKNYELQDSLQELAIQGGHCQQSVPQESSYRSVTREG